MPPANAVLNYWNINICCHFQSSPLVQQYS